MNIKTLITESEYKRTLAIVKQLLLEKRYKEYYIFKKLACCAIFASNKRGFISYNAFLLYVEKRINVYGWNVEDTYDLRRRALWGEPLFGISSKTILYAPEGQIEDELIDKWIYNIKRPVWKQ